MGYKTNVLIIGPSNSGKETVVNNVEWGETRVMVASYASVVLNNNKNYLFMLNGEDNYKSFDEILLFEDGHGPDGIIMVLDSSKGFKENDLEVVGMIISPRDICKQTGYWESKLKQPLQKFFNSSYNCK